MESVNRYLKSFIITSTSTIHKYVIQLINIVKKIKANITEVIRAKKDRIWYEFLSKEWLGTIPYKVSVKALNLITE